MTVVDPDEAGVGTLDVDVLVRCVKPSGEVIVETETIALTESPAGSGTFVADVPTSTGSGSAGNGTLNVQAGDQVYANYSDAIGGSNVPEGLRSLQSKDAVFTVSAGITVSDVLTIDLSDADKGAATRVGGAGSLDVLVRNLASGELETVALSESPDNSGLFSGSLSTAFSGGTSTSGNGTLGVAVGDTIEVQ